MRGHSLKLGGRCDTWRHVSVVGRVPRINTAYLERDFAPRDIQAGGRGVSDPPIPGGC